MPALISLRQLPIMMGLLPNTTIREILSGQKNSALIGMMQDLKWR
jgi:hypothetical protein